MFAELWNYLFSIEELPEGGLLPFVQRSDEWPMVRKRHLWIEPSCRVCGRYADVEVHHVVPVHVDKFLELAPTNLLTLCRPHHLLFGHLGAWASWNADCREDVVCWRERMEGRPYLDKDDEL